VPKEAEKSTKAVSSSVLKGVEPKEQIFVFDRKTFF